MMYAIAYTMSSYTDIFFTKFFPIPRCLLFLAVVDRQPGQFESETSDYE